MEKVCQNCKKEFFIDENDQNFYQKINVPYPTWCPACRMTRRLSFGNAWGVHFRNCAKCDKKTLTMYRPEDPTIVYCDPCWWADDWDGTEYGVDYNPNRNFLEQWKELRMRTPHFAKDALYLTLKNCDYTNAIAFSKNCYLTFWADYCENVYYAALVNTVKDSLDVFNLQKSELCYQSVMLRNCSRALYSFNCKDCVDVWFSKNCFNCVNCIGCTNQRSKSYMIFNQKYSPEEYFIKVKELGLDTRKGIENAKLEADKLWQSSPYRENTSSAKNLSSGGEYIFQAKNAQDCYMCIGIEDSRYCEFVSVPKASNCMDYYGWGENASLIYECASSGNEIQNLKFSFGVFAGATNHEYCGFTIGGKNNFGCINLKRKKYCILNKEYSKEEYEILREKIIEDMNANPYIDSVGRIYKYGEFFPLELSPFPYNDSNAFKFVPKSKEEALGEGYKWTDDETKSHVCTIKGADLPQTIKEVTDAVLKEVIECSGCQKGFLVTNGELALYQRLTIPLPKNCPKCRETERLKLINLPLNRLETNCAKCGKDISTMYKEEDGKIIYCVKCYQGELA